MVFKVQLISPSILYSAAFGLATCHLRTFADAVLGWDDGFFFCPLLVLSLHILWYLVSKTPFP